MNTRVTIMMSVQPDTESTAGASEPYRVASAVGRSSVELSANLAHALRELADEIETTSAVPTEVLS